ncbi:MAG: hypothetical protein ACREIV_03765, partial [Planctomycetaceae bacterium]
MTRTSWVVTLAVLLLPAGTASAQRFAPRTQQLFPTQQFFPTTRFGDPFSFGPRFGFPGSFSASPIESFYRGRADLIRARGQAYEDLTQAAINYEEARARYIENLRNWQELQNQRNERTRMYQSRRNREREEQYATRPDGTRIHGWVTPGLNEPQ